MRRRLVQVVTAFFASGVVPASAADDPLTGSRSLFDGVYVGAQVGYSNFDVEATLRSPAAFIITDSSADFFAGGGMAGYGYSFPVFGSLFYFGIEGEYVWNSAEGDFIQSTVPGAQVALSFKATDSFGATIRLGLIPFERGMVYARAGWQWSRFKLTGTGPGGSATDSAFMGSPRVGFGGEWALTPNFHWGMDWTYTLYGDVGGRRFSVPIPGTAFVANLDQEEKDESRFMLRATWHVLP